MDADPPSASAFIPKFSISSSADRMDDRSNTGMLSPEGRALLQPPVEKNSGSESDARRQLRMKLAARRNSQNTEEKPAV
jgi:hypothetical protein